MGTATSRIIACGAEYLARGWLPVIAYGVENGVCLCRRGKECPNPGKHPIHDGWHLQKPTADQFVSWFEPWPDANLGVAMGPLSGIIDIETDCEEGEDWLAELWDGNAPATATFRSGRIGGGGVHRLYKFRADLPALGNKAIALGSKREKNLRHIADLKLGNGIDEETGKPKGSQSIFPPSMHSSGRAYEWIIAPDDSPPASIPDWVAVKLVALCRPPTPPVTTPPAIVDARAVERCRNYVSRMPAAVSGQGGHNATFNVACECVRFGLGDGDGLAVLTEYNTRCQPPWSEKELRHKLDGARKTVPDPGSRLVDSRNTTFVGGVDLSGIVGQGQQGNGSPPVKNGASRTPQAAKPSPPIELYESFPTDALFEPVASFCLGHAAAIGCDPALVITPMLACLAGAIGSSRLIRLKSTWREPAIIWALNVAASGSHKSPAQAAATGILEKLQADAFEQHADRMEVYLSDLQKYEAEYADWKRAKASERGDAPQKPVEPTAKRVIVGDTTMEALSERLQDNQRGLVLYCDEANGWIGGFDKYRSGKGGDSAHWLSIFHGRVLLIDRKTGAKKTIFVRRPAVSVCGGIQPEVLARVSKQTQINTAIDGDAIKLGFIKLGYLDQSTVARGRLLFEDADDDDIADLDYDDGITANKTTVYDVEGGDPNPFTGDPITSCKASHSNIAEAADLLIVTLEDSTP